jgi:hypothetical protein
MEGQPARLYAEDSHDSVDRDYEIHVDTVEALKG